MEQELAVSKPNGGAIQHATPTPMDLLQIAMSQNADIDKLAKLMELQERWQANEARKAFNVAFSEFKSEAVTIVKNNMVKDGPLKDKRYADLFGVVSAVTPVMSKHGLTHSWKLSRDEPAWMEVTCTIKHVLGHSESVAMGAAPDTGPGRNAIQARGSAKSYLERYTLLAATGMASGEQDDDGNAAGLGSDWTSEHCEFLMNCRNPTELQKLFTLYFKEARTANDKDAMGALIAEKDARKKEICE